jgi:CIC family chloride channel protein
MGGMLRITPQIAGPGIGNAIEMIITQDGTERWYWMPLKWIATTISIATGGGGLVGPSIFIGTTSWILFGKIFQLNEQECQLLALAGLAGGVGAILKAPISGVVMMIEVFLGHQEKLKTIIWPTIALSLVTSIGSYLTVGVLTDFSPLLQLHSEAPQVLSTTLFWAVMGGIVGGSVAKVFIHVFQIVKHTFEHSSLPLWANSLIGTLLASAFVIIFSTGSTSAPQPFEIGRAGLTPLQDALLGRLGFSVIVMMILGKLMDVSLRSGSGNSVGIFGPAMWIGGLAGALTGFLPNFPYTTVPIVSGISAGITTAMGFPAAAAIIIIEIFGLPWLGTGIIGCVGGMMIQWIWKRSAIGKSLAKEHTH